MLNPRKMPHILHRAILFCALYREQPKAVRNHLMCGSSSARTGYNMFDAYDARFW